MLTINIDSPKLEAIYTQKEIKSIINEYIKELEEEKEKEKFFIYEVKEEDLTEEEKEALRNYRKNKENMIFYNLK